MIKKKNKPLWRGWFIFCLKLNDEIDNLKKSFQDGCNTICRCITSLGVNTPDNSAVNTITDNIRTLYNNRYTSGYNQGIVDADARVNTSSASYVAGYNAGRLQGQQDVISNPGDYGIGTAKVTKINYRVTEYWGDDSASAESSFIISYGSDGNISGVTGRYFSHFDSRIVVEPTGWS